MANIPCHLAVGTLSWSVKSTLIGVTFTFQLSMFLPWRIGLVTISVFFSVLFTYLELVSEINDLSSGRIFCSSQQLFPLGLGPLKGFLCWHCTAVLRCRQPRLVHCFWNFRHTKDISRWVTLRLEVTGHHQKQHDANLDCVFLKSTLFYTDPVILDTKK